MNPGDVQEITLAIVWSRDNDRFQSVQLLKTDDDIIQSAFDENAVPGAPILMYPPDAAAHLPMDVLLNWGSVPGAIADYDLEWDTHAAFPNPIQVTTANTIFELENLIAGTTYFWRVRANPPNGAIAPGPWSAVYSFSITTGANTAPYVLNLIPYQTRVAQGLPAMIDLEESPRIFFDPDGDPLSYSAVSSNPIDVAFPEVTGSALNIYPIQQGQATITVTTQDPGGLSATTTFGITVLPAEETIPEPFFDFLSGRKCRGRTEYTRIRQLSLSMGFQRLLQMVH